MCNGLVCKLDSPAGGMLKEDRSVCMRKDIQGDYVVANGRKRDCVCFEGEDCIGHCPGVGEPSLGRLH